MEEHQQPTNIIASAIKICRQSFIAVGVFSFFINVLMLTPMFYLINVFDKAVSTGSIPTLVSLAAVAVFLYVILTLLEWTRSKVLVHIASRLDHVLAPRIHELCFASQAGSMALYNSGAQPLRDLNQLRQFLGGPLAAAFFDLPWIPLLLILMLFFHPVLFVVAMVCIGIMATVAISNQRSTTEGLEKANQLSSAIMQQTSKNLRNAEVAAAMGMMGALTRRWRIRQDDLLLLQSETSSVASGYTALIKTLNMAMQSAAITTGALLVITQEISPGVMIGAALLLGKTMAPIQQVVSGWQTFVDARDNYRRLNNLLNEFPEGPEKMPLPEISGRITGRNVVVRPPGQKVATLSDVSFSLEPGTLTMVLGPSAAGKSTLARAVLGIWPTFRGAIRIDGAEAYYFNRDELGPQIGYLPQDIELFDGSVAENICRFGDLDPERAVKAAHDAGIHEMILALPSGYDTPVNSEGTQLSPGQRQRIALARALYNRPKIIVLDEPNSNLDEAGEQALGLALQKMKSQGSTILMISHRRAAMPLVDQIIILESGRIKDQGPKDVFLKRAKAAQEQARKASPKAQGSADVQNAPAAPVKVND